MWIRFDLEGMKFEIQIKNQHRNTKYFDADDWAEVSFNVQFQNIIQYVKENDEILHSVNGRVVDTTNQRCELRAAIEALQWWERKHKTFEDTILYSDSAYLINCWKDEWYVKWQANGWRNSKKEAVANQDLWEKLIPYFKDKNLIFAKVKGHTGQNDYNDKVDKLAVQARQRRD